MAQPIGRLEKVDLRTCWRVEGLEFTPWLAENIHLLGEAIGLDLEVVEQEKSVGPFAADLLCRDRASETWVLIENQLERTDHTHLGQLITYAAGLEAVTIVWIAQRFTEEHRAALDWLNSITGQIFNFFGIEIELWRIGDSPVAPKFSLICWPNEWSRSVVPGKGLSETQKLQLAFWTQFKEYMSDHPTIRCSKPYWQHWMNHTFGVTGANFSSVFSKYNSASGSYEQGELRVDLNLDGGSSEQWFQALKAEKGTIETEAGVALTWYRQEGVRAKRVYVQRSADIFDQDSWPEYREWLKKHLELFSRVFVGRVRNLKF